ncbi:unnamed protein product [Victoria cruziana]
MNIRLQVYYAREMKAGHRRRDAGTGKSTCLTSGERNSSLIQEKTFTYCLAASMSLWNNELRTELSRRATMVNRQFTDSDGDANLVNQPIYEFSRTSVT